MKVQVKEVSIATPNGHSISACSYFSDTYNGHTLVISSATGVLQKYYANFASFFASHGFQVYTFDYHGIGKSTSEVSILKKNTGDLKNWGANDQAAVVEFAKKENPDSKITLITHSIGGQLLGFNPNHHVLNKVVMVASQSGYWKLFKGIHKLKMWLFWYVLIPFLTPLFGYFPAKRFRLFENLPKNMVYQWAKWGKKKNYMMHFHDQKSYFFDDIEVPILSYSFPFDSFAPIKAVDWLSNQFTNAAIERIHFIPKNGTAHVKHFGFFKSAFKDPLWEDTLQWILNDTEHEQTPS